MGIDIANINFERSLIYLVVVVISIAIHEFGHAFAADRLGDDLPRRQGRVTLLPTEHFDPIGFLMICWMAFGGFGLGWGKPVQVNPGALKHPRRDLIIITAAGPFTNLVLALICGLIMRFTGLSEQYGLMGAFLEAGLFTNLGLMLFNLIPIPPLDGSKILAGVLPFDQSVRYERAMGQYGFMALLALVFLGRPILNVIIGQPSLEIASLLTGMRWVVG